MRKVKKMVFRDAMWQLSPDQMQSLKGGTANDSIACVCSCNNAVGTWFTRCNVDYLGVSFYSYYCAGGHYATCGSV
jgi:hypothetical protein